MAITVFWPLQTHHWHQFQVFAAINLGTCEWDWFVQLVNAIPKLKLPIITFFNTVMNWLDGWLLNGKQSGTFQVGNQDNLSIQMLKWFVLKTTRFYASFLNG